MSAAPGKLRILIVSRSYPSIDNLYQYPFVHRRVRAYQSAGHEVAVFRPGAGDGGAHTFDGVQCTAGNSRSLDRLASHFQPDVLAIHGLGPTVWPVVEHLARSVPMAGWLHGSEIPGFLKRKSALDRQPTEIADELFKNCCGFWRSFHRDKPEGAPLVFPSQTAVRYAAEGLDAPLESPVVIANPIDTDLFEYRPKKTETRLGVLMIRPFDSRAYGNDLAIAAISSLRASPALQDVRFKVIGDGPLFEETVGPIRDVSNVSIHQGFLTQKQVAEEHRSHGIFLVPTRLDTQGVSRDEAMSSGLVPVTNAIEPIDEFVDEACAGLAAPDDADALARLVADLVDDPQAFIRKSACAAERIRATRSSARIIPQDLALLSAASRS